MPIIKLNNKLYLIFNKNLKIIFNFIFFLIILKYQYSNNFISKSPKVSVFLPIYNKQHFLKSSINSIQNQQLEEIEIIAVNDFSTDFSLKILKKLARNDNRIKIINNDRNHGLLYSRAIGILNCLGEYVMNLDPDDKLKGKNNLKDLYIYSKKYNLDFVRFLHRRISLNKLNNNYYKLLDKTQLKRTDCYITNKFIKRKVIFKAYQNFKKKIYSSKWNYHEDNIWSLLIYKYSKSYTILNKYIYLIIKNNESLMANIKKNNIELKNRIYKLETLLELKLQKKKFIITIFKSIFKLFHSIRDIEIKKKMIRIYFKLNKYIT